MKPPCKWCGAPKRRGGNAYCLPCWTLRREAFKRIRDTAMVIYRKALRSGLIAPVEGRSCVDCGAPATRYDHRRYSAPLEVEPVCRSCNSRRGHAVDLQAEFDRIRVAA